MTEALSVVRYAPSDASRWDAFVAGARNGLFLFRRGYMAYHADRFEDCSLLVTEGDRILAVLPANKAGDMLVSHGGLTFGGLVLSQAVRAAQTVEILRAVAGFLPVLGCAKLSYKQVPPFFYEPLSSEDSYALFRSGAKLVRVDANFILDASARPKIQERRLRSAKKARKAGIAVGETEDFAAFWADVLTDALQSRHGVAPVHTCEEIMLLRHRFPENIRLFTASLDKRVVAGTVLYMYRGVTHAQYIAANKEGKETGALDLLFGTLLDQPQAPARFFSFGISTEEQGRVLNEGLADWKEGFGARCVPHSVFELGG